MTDIAPTLSAATTPVADQAGLIGYVTALRLPLYAEPRLMFDGVITELTYAQPVVLGYQTGEFLAVTQGQQRGWVRREAITTDVRRIYPTLMAGVQYTADHPVTERIRLVLSDAFAAGALRLPLTPEEYVSYELVQQQRALPWGAVRPRPAGSWHRLLRGNRLVHAGIEPKTHSVMEWVNPEGVGQLAWVQAVHPDESVRITLITADQTGTYQHTTWTAEEWRECRPVWITLV